MTSKAVAIAFGAAALAAVAWKSPSVGAQEDPYVEAPPGQYSTTVAGVIEDTRTGLKWQSAVAVNAAECGGDAKCTQGEASNYCAALVLGGSSDWRLPRVSELQSIYMTPVIGGQTTADRRFGIPPEALWSASAYVANVAQGWTVDFGSGRVLPSAISQRLGVLCVR